MTEQVGNYNVFFWEQQSPEGHAGWVVAKRRPEGSSGEAISKHGHKADAVAAAKRYTQADKRRTAKQF